MSTRDVLFFGPFRLDGPQGPLRRGGEAVALAPKPLKLLWTLARRAGEVVTKEELLAAVWPRVVVNDGAITTCLSELRIALGDDKARPLYIATVHRIGYRFIAEVRRPDGAAVPAVPPAAHFVGRGPELERLAAAWAAARRGQRTLVFITGEAGIGKSALVHTLLARGAGAEAGSGGATVGIGQCVEHVGSGEPYLPLLDAFGRLCRQPDGARFVALLRRHAPSWLAQLPGLLDDAGYAALRLALAGSGGERMLRELAQVIEVACAHEPLVLVLEDMHWSDRSTVDALVMLARRHESARLLLLVTLRTVELIVNNHPLKSVKQELSALGQAITLPVDYLAPEAVHDYVEQRLPGRAAELAAEVYRRSQGHPLFMMHVADEVAQRSAEAPLAGAGGSGVRELIEAQLARLDEPHQQALEAASVAEPHFSAASVAAGLQIEPERAEQLLDGLARHNQFIEARGPLDWYDGTVGERYAFRHDLYRETLVRRLGAARRARLHARIGDRLEAAYGERAGEIAAELVLHFEEARDASRAALYCSKAGGTAVGRCAYGQASAYVAKGLGLLDALPPSVERDRTELPVRLIEGAVQLATRGFGAPQAEAAYARAQALAQRLGDDTALVRACYGLWHVYSAQGDLRRGRAVADRLLELAQRTGDPMVTMLAHNTLGPWFMLVGEATDALPHIEATLALHDIDKHRFAAVEYGVDPGLACRHYAVLACWLLGDLQAARQHVERGLALARALPYPFGEAGMLAADALLCEDEGDFGRLEEVSARLINVCSTNGFTLWLASGRMLHGAALAARGMADEGVAEAGRGLLDWRATEMVELLPHALGVVSGALAKSGRTDDALALLDEALALVDRIGERWYEAELHRRRGECLLQRGDSAQAEAAFGRAIGVARGQRATLLELRAGSSLARLLQQRGAAVAARAQS